MAYLVETYEALQTALWDFVGSENEDVDAAIRMGYRMAVNAARAPGERGTHVWSFLSPLTTLDVWPTIPVGTNTLTGVKDGGITTLTAISDAFYPSMVGHSIVITTIGTFTITACSSAKVVVVSGDATCAGKTFSITPDGLYSLPDAFGSLVGDFRQAPGLGLPAIRRRPECDVRAFHEAYDYTGDPQMVAIVPRAQTEAHDPALVTKWDAWFWPVPDTQRSLTYKATLRPEMLSDSVTPIGDDAFHGLLVLACLAAGEILYRGGPGSNMQSYQLALSEQIAQDTAKNQPANLGYNEDRSDLCEFPDRVVRAMYHLR
jgi:hypothetical protein